MTEYQYILTRGANSETLTDNPAGWDQLAVIYERHEFYHSVFRSIILSLRFAFTEGGGGEFIKTAYDQDGLTANVSITINKRNPQTDDYDLFYAGVLDFTPERFIIEPKEFVEIGILDTDKQHKFITRDEINYDINSIISTDNISIEPFVSAPKAIAFKPIDIYLNVESAGVQDRETTISTVSTLTVKYNGTLEVNEIGDRNNINDTTDITPPIDTKIYENDTGETVTAEGEIVGTYTLVLTFTPTDSPNDAEIDFFVRLLVKNGGGAVQSTVTLVPTITTNKITIAGEETVTLTGDINTTVLGVKLFDETVEDGWTIEVEAVVDARELSNMDVGVDLDIDYSVFDYSEISVGLAESNANCYFPFEAFTRLIQLMTSETDTTKLLTSDILGRTDSEFVAFASDGSGSLDVITSGWNIRQFPDKPLNVNMRSLFKTYDSIRNIGLGFDRANDRFFISPKEEFYKNELMFDLGEVTEFKRKPYQMGFYSKIISGWGNKVEYEDFQGVNEFNVPAEHSIVIPVKDEKNVTTGYNGDSIGMELARRKKFLTNATKDSKYDENIYTVNTDGAETIQGGTSVSGIPGIAEYYNIALTPRENLIRWGNIFKAPLWKTTKEIKFVKSQKNTDFAYQNQNGTVVNETDDITGAELTSNRLFNPELHEFESEMTQAIITALNSDPHRFVRYIFNDVTYEGFLLRTEESDYQGKMKWTMIAKDVSDETKNRIFESGDNYILEDGNNLIFEE